VDFFNNAGVEAVVHCGDIVAPFALRWFKKLRCKNIYGVYGNNDGEKAGLKKLADSNGWVFGVQPLRVELGGRVIMVVHEPEGIGAALARAEVDVVLWGHLHKKSFENRDGKILLNPGEGGGWVYGKSSVAILDLETLTAEFHDIHVGTPQVL
jgi:putative phosphoesterase